ERGDIVAQFPVAVLLRDVLRAVVGSSSAVSEREYARIAYTLVPLVYPVHPSQMSDIPKEGMEMKPAQTRPYLIDPEPVDRQPSCSFDITHESFEPSVGSEG